MPSRQPIMFKLPDATVAPGFKDGMKSLAEFRVQDFGDAVLVEPAEGAGTVRQYMSLHRLCDAQTDLSDEQVWAPLSMYPPLGSGDASRRQGVVEHAERMAARQDFAAHLSGLSAIVLGADHDELPGVLSEQLPGLFELLPNASVWWLAVDPLLARRFAVLRARLAFELTPDISGSPAEFEGLRLLSAHSLTEGLDFGKAVDPALLAFSPGVSGFSISKLPNGLVVMFGDLLELRVEPPALLSSLYEPRVLHHAATWEDGEFREGIAPSEAEDVLKWWVDGLNVFYSHAADPTGFSDPLGRHDPAAQTGWMLTWERLLADGITLASGVNMPDATRMELAFDLLDKAEQLLGYLKADNRSGKGFKRLVRRGDAVPALNRSWASLPEALRERFEKHTQAVYDTFYEEMRDRALTNRLTPKGLKVASGEPGNLQSVSTDAYVADLVRDVRNSAHGFMEQLQGDQRFRVATHDGTIPTQLTDIAVLVMLAFGGAAAEVVSGSWL
jgi:hypothetical protein